MVKQDSKVMNQKEKGLARCIDLAQHYEKHWLQQDSDFFHQPILHRHAFTDLHLREILSERMKIGVTDHVASLHYWLRQHTIYEDMEEHNVTIVFRTFRSLMGMSTVVEYVVKDAYNNEYSFTFTLKDNKIV